MVCEHPASKEIPCNIINFQGPSFNATFGGSSFTLFPTCIFAGGVENTIFNSKDCIMSDNEPCIFFFAARANADVPEHRAVVFNCVTGLPQIIPLCVCVLAEKDHAGTLDFAVVTKTVKEFIRMENEKLQPLNDKSIDDSTTSKADPEDLTSGSEQHECKKRQRKRNEKFS